MASEEPPSVGLFTVADEPALPAKKRRISGRKRDPVWELTTVFPDKRVVCNRCNALIHRYGVAKVERVRNHFDRRCPKVHEQIMTSSPRAEEGAEITETEVVSVPVAMETAAATKPYKASGGYGYKNQTWKRKFAYWLYATGKPLEDADNELLLGALRVLRGDVVVPTKHELENELLELEFTASKSKVSKVIAGKKCCLTVENWLDAGGCSVTTYGAVCDGVHYYLESKTGATRDAHGEVMPDEVEAAMAKEKKAEFYGIVAPTTTALSKYTRERIQRKHPRCSFFHGCVTSALTLLLSDVTSILPWLERVQSSVLELGTVFHGNHKLQKLVAAGEKSPAAEFPISSSVFAFLEDVFKHEKELYKIVARRDFVEANTPAEQEKLKRVQDFVLGDTFVQDLINSLAIIRPLQQQLQHFQEENQPPLSQVFPCFVDLLTVYSSMEWVSKKEKALITSCVTERFNAIYGDSHGVAYMLDPLFLGEALDARKTQEVETFMTRFCEHEGHTVDILSQLEKYKELVAELKHNNQAYWELLQSGSVMPTDFWVERRQFPHLQQLAFAVFALPASSTSSPSFGAQGFGVHSRFNRALSPEKLQKLIHVYCNSKRGESGGEPVSPGPQIL